MLRNNEACSYDIPTEIKSNQRIALDEAKKRSASKDNLIKFLHDDQIGINQTFLGPFGGRKIVYCDWIASGRGLTFINEYIDKEVLPWYANTHSMANTTSTQTSMLREEARQMIKYVTNAHSDKDSVIFHGNGTTGVVDLLRHIVNCQDAVFLVGEEAHHSLYTPWRDVTQNVVYITDAANRLEQVRSALEKIRSVDETVPIFGCFGAVSNVNGTLYDVDSLAALLHEFKGYIILDYATGAPYITMDMNPITPKMYKDVIVFSPHKFLGGVESPGVMVVKKHLYHNPKPVISGGGTVFYVREDEVNYFKAPELREEGGTPNILGAIRAALACYTKLNVGVETITKVNQHIIDKVTLQLLQCENLVLLDDPHGRSKIPVFSFVIKHQNLFLHHNFVVSLLNDLFGIQTRGGCLCAGPYVQRLLGLTTDLNKSYLNLLSEDPNLDRHHLRRTKEYSSYEVFRPGLVRLSISYTTTDDEISFIIQAVKMVAEFGWKLLPLYRCNYETGEWHHLKNLQFNNRRWLSHIKFMPDGGVKYKSFATEDCSSFTECLSAAQKIIADVPPYKTKSENSMVFAETEHLRWFLLPADVLDEVLNNRPPSQHAPFLPSSNNLSCPEMVQYRHTQLTKILQNCQQRKLSVALKPESTKPSMFYTLFDVTFYRPFGMVISTFNFVLNLVGIKKNKTPAVSVSSYDGTSDVLLNMEVSVRKELQEDKQGDKMPNDEEVSCVLPSKTYKNAPKPKWHAPPRKILKPFVKAVMDFEMIKDKDRVLLCLSGGKDSLSLLHLLRQYQFMAKNTWDINFELGAITIDPLTEAYNPEPLIPYLAELGVPYFYERQGILAQAEACGEVASICSYCSRMKRGRIYTTAREKGYNVVAMGQHLDDLSESFLMSVFHNGVLRTMKANYTIEKGDLRVIRPLIYVRERDLRQFAESRHLPVIPENCPGCFEAPKERHRVKQLIAQQELLYPNLLRSFQKAMAPLYSKSKAIKNKVDDDVEYQSVLGV